MNGGLVDSATQIDAPDDRRIYGVAAAQVIANCDETNQGRVQVRLTWLPGYEPWARLALLDRGIYFIPQKGDEVLVAFSHGDIREPYIVGQLWNGLDHPPARTQGDPINKRVIRTRKDHEIAFDDQTKSITITSVDKHQIEIKESQIKITMAEDKASVTLSSTGDVTIKSSSRISLEAETISIKGTKVCITGETSVEVDGKTQCSIKGAQIFIG